jgi:HEAT repeat protein
VDPLRKRLVEGTSEVRQIAAWALGEIKDQRGRESLLEALKDKDNWVQLAAFYALENF